MSKKILKYIFISIGVLVLLLIYLSTAGIETKKFNKQIQDLVKQKNNKLDTNLKKISHDKKSNIANKILDFIATEYSNKLELVKNNVK